MALYYTDNGLTGWRCWRLVLRIETLEKFIPIHLRFPSGSIPHRGKHSQIVLVDIQVLSSVPMSVGNFLPSIGVQEVQVALNTTDLAKESLSGIEVSQHLLDLSLRNAKSFGHCDCEFWTIHAVLRRAFSYYFLLLLRLDC